MKSPEEQILPNRDAFGRDPFGYSALAWRKWGMVQTMAGFPVDISRPPTSSDLKTPLLWLTQANALSQAASVLIQHEPNWQHMPISARGICDSQYCAVALMIVGYSLEICLKAMLIMQKGIAEYSSDENKHRHHKLEKLADFIPGLGPKDKAILNILTHFVTWAGRYPDPGSGRADSSEEIFSKSEFHQISGKDLFTLSGRIMNHVDKVIADTKDFKYK